MYRIEHYPPIKALPISRSVYFLPRRYICPHTRIRNWPTQIAFTRTNFKHREYINAYIYLHTDMTYKD